MAVFQDCFLAESPEGDLIGRVLYGSGPQALARRRRHGWFWRDGQGILHLSRDLRRSSWAVLAQGPVFLRDQPPDWSLDFYDWQLSCRQRVTFAGPPNRLEYCLGNPVVTPAGEVYLSGDGLDFVAIPYWNGQWKSFPVASNEALYAGWLEDGLVYGGWSGVLSWKEQQLALGQPIQGLVSRPDTAWFLARGRSWYLVNFARRELRLLREASWPILTLDSVVYFDGQLRRIRFDGGEVVFSVPISSPIESILYLQQRGQIAILHSDEWIRYYCAETGELLKETFLLQGLPLLLTRDTLPYDFEGTATFHLDGKLKSLASAGGDRHLTLNFRHSEGRFVRGSGADFEVSQVYKDGCVEQFSAWDDGPPVPVEFSKWLERNMLELLD